MAGQTHNPVPLYAASLERMLTAQALSEREQDPVAAVYLAGVAVELMLQALAHWDGAEHDARHDLRLWLGKCSPRFENVVLSPPLDRRWSLLVSDWRNHSAVHPARRVAILSFGGSRSGDGSRAMTRLGCWPIRGSW